MKYDPHNVVGKYILKGKKAVAEPNLFKWARWLEENMVKKYA